MNEAELAKELQAIHDRLADLFRLPRYQYILIMRDVSIDHATLVSNLKNVNNVTDLLRMIANANSALTDIENPGKLN